MSETIRTKRVPKAPMRWTDHYIDERGERFWTLQDADNESVLAVRGGMREDYAAHIVRCCNSFDALVEALQDVLLDLAANASNGLTVKSFRGSASVERARSALALAKGGAE